MSGPGNADINCRETYDGLFLIKAVADSPVQVRSVWFKLPLWFCTISVYRGG